MVICGAYGPSEFQATVEICAQLEAAYAHSMRKPTCDSDSCDRLPATGPFEVHVIILVDVKSAAATIEWNLIDVRGCDGAWLLRCVAMHDGTSVWKE